MNSADAWFEDEATRDADGLEALLALSVELVETMNRAQREAEMEAAKQRHPAGKMLNATPPASNAVVMNVLNAADRCDQGCGAAALYRYRRGSGELDLCHHHSGRFAPKLDEEGWVVVGNNDSLLKELYANRLKGDDHA